LFRAENIHFVEAAANTTSDRVKLTPRLFFFGVAVAVIASLVGSAFISFVVEVPDPVRTSIAVTSMFAAWHFSERRPFPGRAAASLFGVATALALAPLLAAATLDLEPDSFAASMIGFGALALTVILPLHAVNWVVRRKRTQVASGA
jgi:hypothetical protein